MSHHIFQFLREQNDADIKRVYLSLIAEDCSIIRDFGEVALDEFSTIVAHEYHPDSHPVSNIRIDGKVYLDEHAFGEMRLYVHRPRSQQSVLVGRGRLDNFDQLRVDWYENEDKLDHWVSTLQMFDRNQRNLTLVIGVNTETRECNHIMTQVGSPTFAEEVLGKLK